MKIMELLPPKTYTFTLISGALIYKSDVCSLLYPRIFQRVCMHEELNFTPVTPLNNTGWPGHLDCLGHPISSNYRQKRYIYIILKQQTIHNNSSAAY